LPGSASRSQRSLVAVKLATGTLPVRRASASAPNSAMRSRAACAERVSFHSRASRMTRPSASSTTMPCCWPPTEIAATSSRPPASAMAARSASHHAAGATSVPSGCAARPVRTTAPVSASRTTTLQLWVDESTPATNVILVSPSISRHRPRKYALRGATRGRTAPKRVLSRMRGSAGAEQVLGRELLQAHEAETLAAEVHTRVEVLPRRAVGHEVGHRLAVVERRLTELADLRRLEGLLHLGVGAERRGALLEQQVGAHVRGGRLPPTRLVFGAARLVVEVARAVVGRPAVHAAVLEQVDEREGVVQVAVTEHEVLVVLDAALAVEVDVEELAVPQRLRDAGREVEARHLLVADLGVEAHELGVLELVDEGERVADRRQQDVAAGLVGLGLDREADVVALVERVLAEQVH